jgi:tRNA-Thr(GGU) m(6)t(6)A37 methyltransferase TsaA
MIDPMEDRGHRELDTVTLTVIGHVRTPWRRREDAPHQSSATPDAEGVLEILPAFHEGLADLATFQRAWLLFVFHRAEGWTPRVKPPRGGPKRGVFATRAPHRPAPIGLTSVVLTGVDVTAGRVDVRGVDLLDGTPLLDVKPYLPSVDAWQDAGHGWLEPYLEAGIEPRLKKPYRLPRG